MKITDYTVLFLAVLWFFLSMGCRRDREIFEHSLWVAEMNRLTDQMTVRALEQGYTGDRHMDGNGWIQPVYETQVIKDTFLDNMAWMLYGNTDTGARNKVWEQVVVFLFTEEDRYVDLTGQKHAVDDMEGIWSETALTGELSSSHELRVREIEQLIADHMGEERHRIYFPAGESEPDSQTLSEKSLIVVLKTGEPDQRPKMRTEEKDSYILSVAAIKTS